MLKLSSNLVEALSPVCEGETFVRRITKNPNYVEVLRGSEYLLLPDGNLPFPPGFGGYLCFERKRGEIPANTFLLEPALSYLDDGDIVRLSPKRKSLRTLYRRNSAHNFLLLTERCNNYCLMCSQPPKPNDDSYLTDEVLLAIPLMSPETKCIGLTGGEPSLLGDKLIEVIRCLKCNLPSTGVHILSNGRRFKDRKFAQAIADLNHPDLMIGIPLYSDISSTHDYVVQAHGAFDDTVRGIVNLNHCGVRVELRVVVHKQTYERLPDLARFLRRNLTFVDQVSLMGLELTGFAPFNLEKLWVDPYDYQPQLVEAVELLAQAKMRVFIFNHQLCVLDPAIAKFSCKSISDWKNEYMPECQDCTRKGECGGFFSSAKLRYSAHIRPFNS